MTNFQREGSISNAHVGRDFEARARVILAAHGIPLQMNHKVPCGLGNDKKLHTFDLGLADPPVIVECKSQTWTKGDVVPSAKMKNWAEAMFYLGPIYLTSRRSKRSHHRKDFARRIKVRSLS